MLQVQITSWPGLRRNSKFKSHQIFPQFKSIQVDYPSTICLRNLLSHIRGAQMNKTPQTLFRRKWVEEFICSFNKYLLTIWDFFGRNDAEAETPVLWPPHAKSWLIGKYSDAGRDWRQKEKGTREDETAGWHHRLNGHEFELTPGVVDGQGDLACFHSWGGKESDTTDPLNLTEEKGVVSLVAQMVKYLPAMWIRSLS